MSGSAPSSSSSSITGSGIARSTEASGTAARSLKRVSRLAITSERVPLSRMEGSDSSPPVPGIPPDSSGRSRSSDSRTLSSSLMAGIAAADSGSRMWGLRLRRLGVAMRMSPRSRSAELPGVSSWDSPSSERSSVLTSRGSTAGSSSSMTGISMRCSNIGFERLSVSCSPSAFFFRGSGFTVRIRPEDVRSTFGSPCEDWGAVPAARSAYRKNAARNSLLSRHQATNRVIARTPTSRSAVGIGDLLEAAWCASSNSTTSSRGHPWLPRKANPLSSRPFWYRGMYCWKRPSNSPRRRFKLG